MSGIGKQASIHQGIALHRLLLHEGDAAAVSKPKPVRCVRRYYVLGAVGVDAETNESIHYKIGSNLLFHLKFAN